MSDSMQALGNDAVKTNNPEAMTLAEQVSDLWLKAWQRELGPDVCLTGEEQSLLYHYIRKSKTKPVV